MYIVRDRRQQEEERGSGRQGSQKIKGSPAGSFFGSTPLRPRDHSSTSFRRHIQDDHARSLEKGHRRAGTVELKASRTCHCHPNMENHTMSPFILDSNRLSRRNPRPFCSFAHRIPSSRRTEDRLVQLPICSPERRSVLIENRGYRSGKKQYFQARHVILQEQIS